MRIIVSRLSLFQMMQVSERRYKVLRCLLDAHILPENDLQLLSDIFPYQTLIVEYNDKLSLLRFFNLRKLHLIQEDCAYMTCEKKIHAAMFNVNVFVRIPRCIIAFLANCRIKRTVNQTDELFHKKKKKNSSNCSRTLTLHAGTIMAESVHERTNPTFGCQMCKAENA